MRKWLRAITVLSALTGGACAPRAGIPVPQPFPRPGRPDVVRSGPVSDAAPDGYAITSTALQLRGVPYRDGGASPAGFDCSGFVYYVFAQHGVALPRQVAEQFRAGQPVDLQNPHPGDLVFFSTVAPGASHVGVIIGGDEFVHAPSERGQVRVERLSSAYWSQRVVGARRVVGGMGP